MKKRTILYIGPLLEGGTCGQRMKGLMEIGHEVIPVETEPPLQLQSQRGVLQRLMRRLRGPVDLAGVNDRILDLTKTLSLDIAWVDKGTLVLPDVLRRVKEDTGCLLVHHNTDDVKRSAHEFKNYLNAIHLYDVHFTSNTFNIPEMLAWGAKKVFSAELGYDDELFRPVEVTTEDRKRLGEAVFFIGHWEPTTEKTLVYLTNHGIPVGIRGGGWHRARNRSVLRNSMPFSPIWGEDHVKAICSGRIGLGIVSKWNRNLTAGRIFEIPACGTFLLAERNSSTQSLYVEGKEAEFFSSAEELLEKTRYYLDHDSDREAIAKAGYVRCRSSKYSWKDRVEQMMAQVEGILESKEH